jgi:hypothetical protein
MLFTPSRASISGLRRKNGPTSTPRLGGFVLERLEATNNRKEGARYRLLVLGNDQNPSALSALSAAPEPDHRADGADDADAFQRKSGAVCAFCGKAGELLAVSVSGESVSLHRACIDPWEQSQQ